MKQALVVVLLLVPLCLSLQTQTGSLERCLQDNNSQRERLSVLSSRLHQCELRLQHSSASSVRTSLSKNNRHASFLQLSSLDEGNPTETNTDNNDSDLELLELKALETESERCEQKAKLLQANITSYKTKMADTIANVSKVLQEYRSCIKHNDELTACQDNLSELNVSLSQCSQALDLAQAEADKQEKSVESVEIEFDAYETKLAQLEQDNQELAAQNEAARNHTEQLKADIEAQAKELFNLQQRHRDLLQQQQMLAELEAEWEKLQNYGAGERPFQSQNVGLLQCQENNLKKQVAEYSRCCAKTQSFWGVTEQINHAVSRGLGELKLADAAFLDDAKKGVERMQSAAHVQ